MPRQEGLKIHRRDYYLTRAGGRGSYGSGETCLARHQSVALVPQARFSSKLRTVHYLRDTSSPDHRARRKHDLYHCLEHRTHLFQVVQ